MTERETQLEAALAALVGAIDGRWKGETQRRRDNALGPAIEEALRGARKLVGHKVKKTRSEELDEELVRLRAQVAAIDKPAPPLPGESNARFIAGPKEMPQEDKDRLSRLMTPEKVK